MRGSSPRMTSPAKLPHFPSGFRIFTSSAWMNSLPQTRLPDFSGSSSPSMPLTMPPASRTMIWPAAMSQGCRLRSQWPSRRPAATKAMSSEAAPNRRSPATLFWISVISWRDKSWSTRPICGSPQPLVVEEGALAAFGDIEVVIGRIVDQAGDDDAVALQADRNRKLRDAVQEIGGAVERIDDPGVALVGAFARAPFLADEAVTPPRLGEVVVQHLLGALVGQGDEIRRPLQRHLEIFHLAEVTLEAAAGAARGFDHDVD